MLRISSSSSSRAAAARASKGSHGFAAFKGSGKLRWGTRLRFCRLSCLVLGLGSLNSAQYALAPLPSLVSIASTGRVFMITHTSHRNYHSCPRRFSLILEGGITKLNSRNWRNLCNPCRSDGNSEPVHIAPLASARVRCFVLSNSAM